MIDSHCHLDFTQFDSDRNEQLALCRKLGVSRLLLPGTDVSQWPRLISLCQQHAILDFALGLHPYFLAETDDSDIQLLDNALTQQAGKVLAVGEMGIDLSIDTSLSKQISIFQQQIQLAKKHHLPIIVHHRKSHNLIIQTLKQQGFTGGGVIHAFSGSVQEAQTYIEMGFKLGFGGVITYPRAVKTRNVLKQIPLSAVLLETDAPDMPIMGKQGQRNSPTYLPIILKTVAELVEQSEEVVERVTTDNFNQLFAPQSA